MGNMGKNVLSMLLERWPFQGKLPEIDFQSSGILTLGVEIELQLINKLSKAPESRALEILEAVANNPAIKCEIFQNMLEINTEKQDDVIGISKNLEEIYTQLHDLSLDFDIDFATTGCHPFAHYADALLTPTPRYHELIDRNQWLARRINVYGLHVHLGMKSSDDCIRFNNFFLNFLPHLLALSASSPFWQGEDTGLASCRSTLFEALPTAGQPYQVENWQEFQNLYHTLKKCDAIRTLKDLWWDMRPSPGFGTLEIRVCDGPATLAEVTAITAYIHLLAYWFQENGDWIDQVPPPTRWLARENKWRVMRHGLDALLVKNLEGKTIAIRQDISDWIEKLTPYSDKFGYQNYMQTLMTICDKGNSAQRQRKVYQTTQSFEKVVEFNVQEFLKRSPIWDV